MIKNFVFVLALLLTFTLPARAADKPLRVVTSFSILSDMTATIGSDAVHITSLVGPDADAHSYQPTPEDAKTLSKADIIIVNGLGYEGWMDRLITASGTHAKIIVASNNVKPRMLDTSTPDPHAWQDLANGMIYAGNIADALTNALPDQRAALNERAAKYVQQMREMAAWVHKSFADIPLAQRKIITSHSAFGYFGDAYGVTFLAPAGISSEAEPSAMDVAKLIEQIKAEHIKRVFIENMTNPRLIEQIGKDTGAHLGGTLYSDALSQPNGAAPTYLDLFMNNVPEMRAAMLLNKP